MENKLLSKQNKRLSTRQLVVIGMLSAITMVLGMTPLGIIQLPFMSATIMHVPVIIGAILEGPVVGGFIGLIFGIFSWSKSFSNASITAFMFMNPIVSILPRVLIGVLSYYIFVALRKVEHNICKRKSSVKEASAKKHDKLSIIIASLCGSLVNTIGVLGLGYLFYFQRLAEKMGTSSKGVGVAFLGIAATNGIPEAIVCAFVTTAVVIAARRVFKNKY